MGNLLCQPCQDFDEDPDVVQNETKAQAGGVFNNVAVDKHSQDVEYVCLRTPLPLFPFSPLPHLPLFPSSPRSSPLLPLPL